MCQLPEKLLAPVLNFKKCLLLEIAFNRMASYELVFKKSVAQDLRSIPKKDVARILKRIEDLRDDPRGEECVKLSAKERYRVHQGIYRIIYEIQDSKLMVIVVKVAHRFSVYRNN